MCVNLSTCFASGEAVILNRDVREWSNMTITRLFASIASTYPSRTAVIAGQESINYAQLDDASNRIAHLLLSEGVRLGSPVVLLVDRSIHAIIGMLGIIKSGAYYVPIEWMDTDIEQTLEKIGGSVILTTSHISSLIGSSETKVLVIDAQYPMATKVMLDPDISESSLVYTIFTSGSSGVAKGVQITHANLLHYSLSLMKQLSIAQPLNYAFVSSFSTDLGNTCIYLSLLSGGCLHLVDQDTRRDPRRFQLYLGRNDIDVLKITPSHFTALFGHYLYLDQISLEFLIFGGEKLRIEIVKSALECKLARTIVNHYGPTETTIGASCYVVTSIDQIPLQAKSVPIGWPIGQTDLRLLDSTGQCVSVEGNGELFIGGPSVARGYYNNEQLTAERFIEMDLDAQGLKRYYRTGDLCYRYKNGCLEFLGRCDRQIKVRGFRV